MAATRLDEATGDLPPPDSEPDLIMSSMLDKTNHFFGSGYGPVRNSGTCLLIQTVDYGVATGGAVNRAQGVYLPVSRFHLRGTFGHITDCAQVT